MRKILAALAALISLVAFTAGPANADTDGLNCTYDNANVARIDSGYLRVTLNGSDDSRLLGTAYLGEYDHRTWDYRLLHNGSLSASGTQTAQVYWQDTFINLTGPDTIKFVVENRARTVRCVATVVF